MLRILPLVLIFALMATAMAAVAEASNEPHVEGRFDKVLVDAGAQGTGYLVGVSVPSMEPEEPLYWDLNGADIQVETWTRYYRTVAGAWMRDPDRPDVHRTTDYDSGTAVLLSHAPNADLAIYPQDKGTDLSLSASVSTSSFQVQDSYLHYNDFLLPAPLGEVLESDRPSDPRYFHSAGTEPNFEYSNPVSTDWVQAHNNFTLTFLYGIIEVHNETGLHRVSAQREHITGNPPVYEEYSITRAFIHVTNGSAYVQPGGRPLQVNLADYDIPSSSTIRLVNASGTLTSVDQEVPFSNANLRVSGSDLRLQAQPVARGENLFQEGGIQGSIDEVTINGSPVELERPSAARIEDPSHAPLKPWILVAVLTVLGGAGFGGHRVYESTRRRQAIPLAQRAEWMLDQGDYDRAARLAQKSIRRDPGNAQAASALAVACLEGDDPGKAVACLERVRDEDDPLIRLLLSVSLREAGQPNQAKRMLRGLLEEHPHLLDLVARTDLIRFAMDDEDEDDEDRDDPVPGYG